MFRVRSPSLASVRRGSNQYGTRCFGLISGRMATLILALIGVFAHFQTFRHLEVLYDSFPTVPKSRNGGGMVPLRSEMIMLGTHKYGGANRIINPSQPADVVLDSEFNFIQEHHQQQPSTTPSSSSSIIWAPLNPPATITSSPEDGDDAALAMVKPTRWFNLLPKRPWGEGKSSPEQDEERKSWEAARMLTIVMKVYTLASMLASLIGIHGVLRSNLFSTRIFLLSSFIDVFLFALSVMSVCIVITYPEIRSMLCEQISSGELHSLLNYVRGTNQNSSSNASVDPSIASSISQSHSSAVLPAANFISKSASNFWSRTLDGASGNTGNDENVRTYWWDMLIDDMLENESCDDIFLSVLVPIGLLVCLIYLAIRVHFLFVIRSFYTSLIRKKMGFYLESSSSSNTSKSSSKENLSTINEKFEKV